MAASFSSISFNSSFNQVSIAIAILHLGSQEPKEVRDVTGSGTSWWNYVRSWCSKEEVEVAAVILWSLWLYRNNKVWNNKTVMPHQIVSKALDLL
ncbi:hypothetical protein LguiA_018704 [Lonicera macranthoides]